MKQMSNISEKERYNIIKLYFFILYLEICKIKNIYTYIYVYEHRKNGHSCFENIFGFNVEILKWDYIALIKEKYNCLNNCLLQWSHFI